MRWGILLGLICMYASSAAQEEYVINYFVGDTSEVGMQGMTLTHSEEHRVIVHFYQQTNKREEDQLRKLLTQGINYFLDQSVLVHANHVELRKKPKKMHRQMEEMVREGLEYYAYKHRDSFQGFSPDVLFHLEQLEDLNWKGNMEHIAIAKGIKGRSREEKAYLYVQHHLSKLKLLIDQELAYSLKDQLLTYVGSEAPQIEEDQMNEMLSELHTF
ncbi:MAG: hypothetical protein HRT74_01120, partial [Flavobacteriales bacterium]|nr:hypothetical protein [Flavobacteriales bacterium]